jgi:hypothetical protein
MSILSEAHGEPRVRKTTGWWRTANERQYVAGELAGEREDDQSATVPTREPPAMYRPNDTWSRRDTDDRG